MNPFRSPSRRLCAFAVGVLMSAALGLLGPGAGYAVDAPAGLPVLFPGYRLLSVTFDDALHGWASGDGGAVVHTSDGGATWIPVTRMQGPFQIGSEFWVMPSIAFTDSTHGFVARQFGEVDVTTDGGLTWSRGVSMPVLLSAIAFHGESGIAAGGPWAGLILTTSDGAATWVNRTPDSWTDRKYWGVAFADGSRACAVGSSGLISISSDAGETWRDVSTATDDTLRCVDFADETHGWVSGDRGTVLVTTDGGLTWSAQVTGVSADLLSVSFADASNGWAVGTGGTIVSTTDGGATWSEEVSGVTANLNGVSFADPDHGCAVGDGGTVATTIDGGAHWIAQSLDALTSVPTTSLRLDPSPNEAGWSRSDVTVHMSAVPCCAMDSVNGPWYSIDSNEGVYARYSVPFMVSAEGVHVVRYWSASANLTAEPVQTATITVCVDRTPPTISLVPKTSPDGSKSVVVEAKDGLSGVGSVQVRLDGGPWLTKTAVSTSTLGPHLVEARAYDTAGNARDARTTLTVLPKPNVGIPHASSVMWRSRRYTVSGYLKPFHKAGTHPVRIYEYRLVSGHWKSYGYVLARASTYLGYTKYSASIRLARRGKWRLRAYAVPDSRHAASWSVGYRYVTVR